jgi:signal peptidase I
MPRYPNSYSTDELIGIDIKNVEEGASDTTVGEPSTVAPVNTATIEPPAATSAPATAKGTPAPLDTPPANGASDTPVPSDTPPAQIEKSMPPYRSEVLPDYASDVLELPPFKKPFGIRYFSFILLAALIIFVVISNCFIKINVVGSSMEPAFKNGDVVWVSRWKSPAYGDVVVAYNPEGEPEFLYKRVVGFAGDSFFFKDGNLYRIKKNAAAEESLQQNVDADFILEIFRKSTVFSGENLIYAVPENCLFLLGDNFNISKDSRFFGSVKRSAIYAVVY